MGVLQGKLVLLAMEVPCFDIAMGEAKDRHLAGAGGAVSQCCPMWISNDVLELPHCPAP